MRIGIDAHVLGKNLGGVERFVAELVKALPQHAAEHQFIVFVTKAAYETLQHQSSERVTYVPLAFSNPLLERLLVLPWLIRKHRLDALMVQRLAPFFVGGCRMIVAIHDLTPIKFAHLYKGLSNILVRALTKNTIKRADLILTPTKAIRDEIKAYCPAVKAPIMPFYNGVDTAAFYQQQDTPYDNAPYLLIVGAIERRKNIETIINVLPLLQNQQMQLRIMGGIRDQQYFDELMALVQDLNVQDRVHYQGFVDEQTLINHYQQASLFITASKDEGFNIPPLESMACGVTVLCSSIPVHLELFQGAAIFFKPESVNDLHRKVEATLAETHIQETLRENGYDKVKQFTWDNTALNVAKALKAL